MSEHNKVEVNLDKPYEEDVVNVRGIVYFGVGLFLLIVVTFGLMWLLQYGVLQSQADEADARFREENPMAMTEEENLPDGPRLQGAPGFGIDTKDGRVSLELREPQAEWRILEEQYKEIWENGEKSEDGKTVIALPIDEAKEKLLKDASVKAASGKEAEKDAEDSQTFVTESSSGRVSAGKIR